MVGKAEVKAEQVEDFRAALKYGIRKRKWNTESVKEGSGDRFENKC